MLRRMRVVLIHGYLAPTALMRPLQRRLTRLGHTVSIFGYPSRRGTLQTHADALYDALERTGPTALVAHSMGGLIVHRLLHDHADLPVSHRIFVATPHRGSRIAARSTRSPLWRVMGPVVRSAVRGVPVPAHPAPIGVVLGARDRTVRPEEADLADAADRLVLPAGHNQLLLKPQLAPSIDRFLVHQRFDATPSVRQALRA
jgi:pimeloyl-ACP methyl ester carboxylesterase